MRPLPVYVTVLAAVAGACSLAGILYQTGLRPPWLERFHLVWRLGSDELASTAYRQRSLPMFELAVRRDTASPYRWCDYGEALLTSGDAARARRAMRRGLELGPAIAPILMRQVNFARRTGDLEAALRCGRRLLALASAYDDAIFTAWNRMGLPASNLLASGLPDRRAAQAYLRHTLEQPDPRPTLEAWSWLRTHGYADDPLADDSASALLKRNEYTAAWQIWTSFAAGRDPDYPERTVIFNGSFERDPAGKVFDWRIDAVPGAIAARDTTVAAEGKASLRLDFDHTANLADCGVSQRMLLPPGRCHFEARMRTRAITTDQGLSFRIFDPEDPRRLDARTEPLAGTHDWTPLSADFLVPPATHLVEIHLVRTPSLKFDNQLAGTAWVDQLLARATSRQH